MLRFRRPRSDAAPAAAVAGGGGSSSTTRKKKKNKKSATPSTLFPLTIFTDCVYTRGILVPNNNNTTTSNNNAAEDGGVEEVVVQIPNDYFGQDNPRTTTTSTTTPPRTIPALSENDAARWNDNYAAQAAARRRSPMNAVRLLGTITLSFEEKVRGYIDKVYLYELRSE